MKERVCFQDNVARICLLTRLLDASMSGLDRLQSTGGARDKQSAEHSWQQSPGKLESGRGAGALAGDAILSACISLPALDPCDFHVSPATSGANESPNKR